MKQQTARTLRLTAALLLLVVVMARLTSRPPELPATASGPAIVDLLVLYNGLVRRRRRDADRASRRCRQSHL